MSVFTGSQMEWICQYILIKLIIIRQNKLHKTELNIELLAHVWFPAVDIVSCMLLHTSRHIAIYVAIHAPKFLFPLFMHMYFSWYITFWFTNYKRACSVTSFNTIAIAISIALVNCYIIMHAVQVAG